MASLIKVFHRSDGFDLLVWFLSHLCVFASSQTCSLDKREDVRDSRTHFLLKENIFLHKCICKFIQINLDAHTCAPMHTHTPWRIDKQAPGTHDCSLNKQPLLCLLHPTRPHPLPTASSTTVHTYKHGLKPTEEYMKTQCLI